MEEKKKKMMIAGIIIVILVICSFVVYLTFNKGSPNLGEELSMFNLMNRTATSVTYGVTNAPDGARVAGTQISISQKGVSNPIDHCRLFSPAGNEVAWFTPETDWHFVNGSSESTLNFVAGMKILITVEEGISVGNVITIFSNEAYFGTSTLTVS